VRRQQPAVWRFIDFSVREAQRLADLASIKVDLNTTENICDLFITERQKAEQPEALVLIEALCTAAIVRYGRSFVSGVREMIPSNVIEQLPQEVQESHRFFKDLRDKWVAHSVNAFEDTHVVAYLTPEELEPKSVSSISALPNRIVCLSIQDMLRLKKLAAAVRARVSRLIEDENEKVLSHARSLPTEQLYSQIDPPQKLATDKDAGKARRKW